MERSFDYKMLGLYEQMKNSIKSEKNGRYTSIHFTQIRGIMRIQRNSKIVESHSGPNKKALDHALKDFNLNIFNSPSSRQGESPSADCQASARGLAKLASVMVNGGGPILSQDGCNQLHANPKVETELPFGHRSCFT